MSKPSPSRKAGPRAQRGSKTINLAINTQMLEQFEQVTAIHGHGKQKGLVLSAAILMFLEADPRHQQRCVLAVMEQHTHQGMEQLLAEARAHQAQQVKENDAQVRPRLAAKIAPSPRTAIRRLPTHPGVA
jgi:hypothetical protein